ncbi:MAG: hypothetical protein Q9173_006235 [Seirophora scorigena]
MNYDLRGKNPPAIPIGSLVLVTGISGCIGSHVADQLLQAGYRERGTVRDEIKGVSGVAHVASDVTFAPDPNKVIPGVIAAAISAASAAAKQASGKRFVYTSSSAAITNAKPNVEHSISASQWNDVAVVDAWAPPPYTPDRGLSVYAASKVQAEMLKRFGRKGWTTFEESIKANAGL